MSVHMSNASSISQQRSWMIPTVFGVAIVVVVARARPNFQLIFNAAPVLQVHLLAAVAMLGLGVVMMTSLKGRILHRVAGWIWVTLVLTVGISSLFITMFTPGHWSFFHINSGIAVVGVTVAVAAARRHNVKTHRLIMMLLFYGILLGSAATAFIPGRLMWKVFVG
jgi:uncharacterized membrane protein